MLKAFMGTANKTPKPILLLYYFHFRNPSCGKIMGINVPWSSSKKKSMDHVLSTGLPIKPGESAIPSPSRREWIEWKSTVWHQRFEDHQPKPAQQNRGKKRQKNLCFIWENGPAKASWFWGVGKVTWPMKGGSPTAINTHGRYHERCMAVKWHRNHGNVEFTVKSATDLGHE